MMACHFSKGDGMIPRTPGSTRRSHGTRAWLAAGVALLTAAWAIMAACAATASNGDTEARIRLLRERARKVNGFLASLSVQAGPASQSGTLLFLAPDQVHMEMKIPGLGKQKVISDGRLLWTITPDARLATKVDLAAVERKWHKPLPNQATAIRDVFEVVKPGSARFVKDEPVDGVMTHLFEGVPEIGVDLPRKAVVPNRVRAWIGEDGLLRRQVLMSGSQVLMDATFTIKNTNPKIRPGLFTFTPPKDYEVQDLTEPTLQSLRSLAGG